MKHSGVDLRRLLLIAVAAYLLGGVLYVAASAWKNRNEPRVARDWAEPFLVSCPVFGLVERCMGCWL